MTIKNFKIGYKVRVIQAEEGAYGANNKIGVITNKPSTNGLNDYKKGIHVEFENKQIWNIGKNPKLELLNSTNKSIYIYTNGTTITAVLNKGNKVIKTAMAKCHPDDTYDFESGARIAFDRLCNELAESSKFTSIKEVKRPAKVGEYIKIVHADSFDDCYKNGDILKVADINDDFSSDYIGVYAETNKTHSCCDCNNNRNNQSYICNYEYVVLENYIPKEKVEEKPKFRPYLHYGVNINDGYIGEETTQEDLLGNKLKIGDTVILYCDKKKYGERIVCKEKDDIDFVRGVKGMRFKQGRCDEWSIIKNRSYEEIKNNEDIDGIKYILSE